MLEHGLANESIRNIAQKIGTSHRMINYHFGSSEGFWEALINEIRSVLDGAQPVPAPIAQQVEHILRLAAQMTTEPAHAVHRPPAPPAPH